MKTGNYILAILLSLSSRINFAQTGSLDLTSPRTNTNLCLSVTDGNSDKLQVKFYGRKKNALVSSSSTASTTGKFTIVLLPDTQYYTAEPQGTNGGSSTILKREIRWIVNNRAQKNIVYVGQLGDCTEHGDGYEVEWKRSDTAMKLLEDSGLTGLSEGIPYGICVGNHDQTPNGSAAGTTNFYNKYFGSARFKGRSYYGGHFGTNNDNSYELFSVGNIDFLVINFEYHLSTASFTKVGGALDWGENLIKKYPNRNVIVLSHYVLNAGGLFSAQGDNIYQRFKIYPNFKLMSGGHYPDSAAEAVSLNTYNGNSVYTVLSNYQGRVKGGNGLLRIYEFDPSTNNVAVKTYSPNTGAFETDANSQFNMNIPLITNSNPSSADIFHLISELNNVPANSSPRVAWNSLEENASYEWYAEVFDGKNKITSSTLSFTTGHPLNLKSNDELQVNKILLNISKESFTIYPNPNSTNKINIYFNKEIKGKINVQIFNTTGDLLLQKTFLNINNRLSIDHNLPAG